MRRFMTACILFALMISIPGCVIVLGSRDLDDDIEVVEIDGEFYIKDESTRPLRKVEQTTTTETETATTETKSGQP